MIDEQLNILVIEDDPAHARIVERAFEKIENRHVTMVTTIAAAREQLAAKPFDVILSDLILPDGRGVELLDVGQHYGPPIVLMTSQGDEETAVSAMKAGAFDYVVKSAPTLLELPHVADRIVREWRLRAEKHQADIALRESESRVRAILNAVPDLILICSRQGEIMECEGNANSLPVSRAEILSIKLDQFVAKSHLNEVQDVFRRVINHGDMTTFVFESRLKSPLFFEGRFARYGTNQILAVLRDVTTQQSALGELAQLSGREQDVLNLVMQGFPNKLIGTELGISIKTVETHRSNLMKKLRVKSVAELAKIAISANQD